MEQEKTDKKETILKAAMEAFAEFGFHGAPTSLIAQKAGVGVGTIYRYFENKDDLIEAIHEEAHAVFVGVFGENYQPDLPVRENFFSIFSALTKLFISSPCELRFMEQYYNSPYGVAKKRAEEKECDRPLVEFFNQGTRQQVIKDLPFAVLLGLSFGPILLLVRDHLNGFITLDAPMIAAVIGACWDAVKL